MAQNRKSGSIGCAVVLLVCLLVFLGTIGAYWYRHQQEKGKTEGADIALHATEIHTQGDLELAAEVVLETFEDYTGCTLNRLWYDGEQAAPLERELAESHAVDSSDVLVLFADLQSGESTVYDPGNGMALVGKHTHYTEYHFALLRDENGWHISYEGTTTEPEATHEIVTPTPAPTP